MQSLNMLIGAEGRERSAAEYEGLLRAAGFSKVDSRVAGAYLDAVLAIKMTQPPVLKEVLPQDSLFKALPCRLWLAGRPSAYARRRSGLGLPVGFGSLSLRTIDNPNRVWSIAPAGPLVWQAGLVRG